MTRSIIIPPAALNQHVAILGKTGSGKTYAAKGIVEGLLRERRQVCVLDPTGAWFGMRVSADGKSKGFDVVLIGGTHGDIPLSSRSGAAVARLVTEQRASVVVDTSGMTVGEYTQWFTDFASTLYTTIREPLSLVVDEAHYFAPQGRVMDPAGGKMLHAANRLMSGGRSKGIRAILITQRPAKLHKDSLSCADTLIAMRVIAPQDRQAIKDWIDGAGDPAQGKEVLDSLAGLARGEGWVWYPEGGHLQRVKFPDITTYDSSATPVYGSKSESPTIGAIKLDEVRAAMAEAVREAEANDPKLLRQRIAELERTAKGKTTATPDPAAIERSVSAAVSERDRHWRGELATVVKSRDSLAQRITRISELCRLNGDAPRPVIDPPVTIVRPNVTPRTIVRNIVTATASGISPRQQRFLDAAASLTTLGAEVTRETVCGWVGVHPRGGSVGEELSALESGGYITNDRGRIAVTDLGLASAGHVEPSEAIARAKSGLSARQARFFEVIFDAYPDHVTREQIAERFEIHPRGGSLGEDLGRLVGRGLVEADRGRYKARDFLFAGQA